MRVPPWFVLALAAAPSFAAEPSRLAKLQGELSLSAEELETLRAADPAAVLPDPALKPFFKDRDRALDALYRTLAVFDYGRAARDKGASCAPAERRHALIAVRDGLFAESDGAPSPWLRSLLGDAAGRTVGPATRRPVGRIADEREYELLRLRLRRLTRAADSGAGGAHLSCERAAVYEALARARAAGVGGRGASGRSAAGAEGAVVLILTRDGDGLRARGAGVLVRGASGTRVLLDAGLLDGATAYALAKSGAGAALTVERREGGVAVARADGLDAAAALALADAAPAPGALVGAVAHLRAAGAWTRTQGLVTAASAGAFRTDAALSPDMRGGAVVDAKGRLAGLLIGGLGGAPFAVDAPTLSKILAGAGPDAAPAPPPGYAQGTASILSAATPFDAAPPAPGSAAIAAGLPSNSGGVCWDGGCGGGLPNARPSGNYGRPSSQATAQAPDMTGPMMGLMAQALGGLIGNMLAAPPPQPQGTRFFGQTVSPGRNDPDAPDKGKTKPKPELVGVDLMIVPGDAKPGDSVNMIATLVMYDAASSGEPYSRAGYEVTFDADPTGSLEIAWPKATTDDGGHASVSARVAPGYAGEPARNDGLVATGLEVPAGLIMATGAPPASVVNLTVTGLAHVSGLTGSRVVNIVKEDPCAAQGLVKNPNFKKKRVASGAAPTPDAPTPPQTGPGGKVTPARGCASTEAECETQYARHAAMQFDCKNKVRKGGRYCAPTNSNEPDADGGGGSVGGQASPPSGDFAKGAEVDNRECVSAAEAKSEGESNAPPKNDSNFAKSEGEESAAKPGNESKPENAPSGTVPIDKSGLTREQIHDVKDAIGAGARDWTGISPDGHVISSEADGTAVDHGPWRDLTHN